VHRRVPLAASTPGSGEEPSQPPEPSLPLVPGQRRPAVRVRVETGLWRAALRMRDGRLTQCQAPWRSRIVNARSGTCRTMPPVAYGCPCPGGEKAARDCLSDADIIRRSSGPRAESATQTHTSFRGAARARPSGPGISDQPARANFRRGPWRARHQRNLRGTKQLGERLQLLTACHFSLPAALLLWHLWRAAHFIWSPS
jgi:hypothetical protein